MFLMWISHFASGSLGREVPDGAGAVQPLETERVALQVQLLGEH